MKFHKKIILAGVVAALILSVAVILFFKEFQIISPEKMLKIMSDKVDLVVRNVLYREVGGGDDSKWEIKAQKASYAKKNNQALFEKVEVKIFLPEGRTFVLAGDKGWLDTEKKDITVSGNVGITSDGNERFETDHLQYSYAEKMLLTDAAVVMNTPLMFV